MHKHIAQTWAQRAQAELGAAQRFRSMLSGMQEHGIPASIISLVEKAVEDEECHAFLCAKMALHWKHDTGFEKTSAHVAIHTRSWEERSSRDVLFLDTLMMCCVTESLNASLLHSIYSRGGRSAEGRLVHKILKDEVQHAQIGWAMLQYESTQRNVSFVSEYLTEMLDMSVRDALFSTPKQMLNSSSYSFGVMPHSDRFDQFRSALEEVLCPGFAHYGIDASSMMKWVTDKSKKV